MKKYTIQREKRKMPLVFFILLLLTIIGIETYYFGILYSKRASYLNIPDYKPITFKVHNNLLFLNGSFPLSAEFNSLNLFIFKGLSMELQNGSRLKIFSDNPYTLIFSDGYHKYKFFGKILYLRVGDDGKY